MRVTTLSALFIGALVFGLGSAATAQPTGDYRRVVLVSWDGVRRDVLLELLDAADPGVPCWRDGTVFPVATGRLNTSGQPGYTCLPALGGVKPPSAPETSPAYGAFQIVASHTTNDGETYTKPQHASMLTGYNAVAHGLLGNKTAARMPVGATIYEHLMDAYDPITVTGRNGFTFRTHHSADRKYIESDRRLYGLMELLRQYGWEDAAILVTTDHGFTSGFHSRNSGRNVFNTWIAALNVNLTTTQIPLRTLQDYCASQQDPMSCLVNGPEIPMPPQDVVPNVYVTSVTPTILDMLGCDGLAIGSARHRGFAVPAVGA